MSENYSPHRREWYQKTKDRINERARERRRLGDNTIGVMPRGDGGVGSRKEIEELKQMEPKFNDLELIERFYREVAEMVEQGNINHLDASIALAEKHNIELELVGTMINNNVTLKSHLTCTAEDLRFIKRVRRLPI
jgi:hypothetical protein